MTVVFYLVGLVIRTAWVVHHHQEGTVQVLAQRLLIETLRSILLRLANLLAVGQKRSIAQAAADLIRAEDFIYIDAGTTTLAMVRALSGPALEAHYVTNGIAHARLLAQKSCHVCVPGGLLRPRTEAIIGAAAITALQQFNFTKAFIGANGVALNVGFTTPDPEEAAVKAVAVRRARETWYLVDDSKFGRVYPAVIGEIYSGAILTNRCPDPKYRQLTLVKETEQ